MTLDSAPPTGSVPDIPDEGLSDEERAEMLPALETRRGELEDAQVESRRRLIEEILDRTEDSPSEKLARQEAYSRGFPFANFREAYVIALKGGGGLQVKQMPDGQPEILLEEGLEWADEPPNYAVLDLRLTATDLQAKAECEAAGQEFMPGHLAYYSALHKENHLYINEKGQIALETGYTWVGAPPNYATKLIEGRAVTPADTTINPAETVNPTPTSAPKPAPEPTGPTKPSPAPPKPTSVPKPEPDSVDPDPQLTEALTPAQREAAFKKALDKRYANGTVLSLSDGIEFDFIPDGKSNPVTCKLTPAGILIEGQGPKTIRSKPEMKLWVPIGGDVLDIGGAQIDKVKKVKTGFEVASLRLTNVKFGSVVNTPEKETELIAKLNDAGVTLEKKDSRGSMTFLVTDISKLGVQNNTIKTTQLFKAIESGRGRICGMNMPETVVGTTKEGLPVKSQGSYSMDVV